MKTHDINSNFENNNEIQALIPSSYVRIIAQQLGGGLKIFPALLRHTGLSIDFIQEEDSRISAQNFIQIFENALNITKAEDFGFQLGDRLKPTTHGAMGFLIYSCPNLFYALEAIKHFLPTRIGFAEIQLQQDHHQITCSIHFKLNCTPAVYRTLIETCMIVFKECAETILGTYLTQAKLHLSYPKPSHHHVYQEIFHCDYVFSEKFDGISLPLSLCQIANTSANQENYLIAKRQCELVLQELLKPQNTFQFRISKLLLQHLTHPKNETEIANELFMSKRTMARHLEKEGVTFREVKEQVMAQQSAYFLQNTQLSIETIGILLNYHDASNFRRAFKRWYSVTPSQFRQNHMNNIN